MLTSPGSDGISTYSVSKPYYTNPSHGSVAQPAVKHDYDSISFSSGTAGGNRFHMDMVSRLAQEVRTSTTTGDIQSLKQAVASGTYTPDPMMIAGRMMLSAEV